jgi:hypothetical protein
MHKPGTFPAFNPLAQFWQEHREASRNWLALGVMLAAWNLTNDEVAKSAARRPEALRRYDYVSVRAVQRMADEPSRGASDRHPSVKML